MGSFILARVIHVLGVVFWIGGVAMVTTVLLPAVRRFKDPEERVAFFERVEARFARQARWTTLITGASGLYMLNYLHGWAWIHQWSHWWVGAMILVWAIFTLMLFVLEPLVLHRLFRARAARDPGGTFAFIQRMHWVLLLVSLIAVAGAVAGSHGWTF
ncbi:MAG: hypothetical protein B7Z66_03970 [Chromatiales bacterium 21-64-14]|nr:MAG: hypothetical protein B7Z66_03970 [Chromatiales bacterium 21-64-14]HQU14763.1 hypothetical protein [Gammaproteobacteria bacterium]